MSCLPELLERYSNMILCIEDDENPDPLWQRFYQIQMAAFILGNKHLDFELQNALKAYQLISDKWDELESYFLSTSIPVNNYDNLFKQIFIDFS